MLKEKLGICPHEENYYEEEIIKIKNDIEETSNEELIEIINPKKDKTSNESDEETDEELIEIINPKKDETSNESDKETSDEELIEIISPKKDENTKDWYDTNKFKIILTTIDSNNFNHKNKIGKLKFNDINNLINNIKDNKKAEIKNKRLILVQRNY